MVLNLPNAKLGRFTYPPGQTIPAGFGGPRYFLILILGKTMKKHVNIAINQKNLVQNLKFSFTNRSTVLGELMQNARRAGATKVVFCFDEENACLTVTDDGCGIENAEDLLTVAESGWDEKVKANEHPFGMGFMSALYSCQYFILTSKCGQLAGSTADALALGDIDLDTGIDWGGTTTIELFGFGLSLQELESKLKALAKGFPIPVLLNGEELPRPAAVDQCQGFVDVEVGLVYVAGNGDYNIPRTKCVEVFLQGLPIYKSHEYNHYPYHLVHLDPRQFFARIPDRDTLIDEREVIKQVKDCLDRMVRWQFIELKATLLGDTFVGFYDALREWNCLDLLNDIDWVPVDVLCEFTDYPVSDTDLFGSFLTNQARPIHRSAVENREVEIVDLGGEDIDYDGAARHMFAWKRGCLVFAFWSHSQKLEEGHWLHQHVRRLQDEEFKVELVNEKQTVTFKGQWNWLGVTFCDAYRLVFGNDRVEIEDTAYYQGQDAGETIIMPVGDTSAQVIAQTSTFRNGSEDFEESAYDADCDAFRAFVIANTVDDPAVAFKQLLPYSIDCPFLFKRQFMVGLDEKGRIAFVKAA